MAAEEAHHAPPTAEEAASVAEFRVALRRFQHQTEIVARACEITPRWYLLLLLVKGATDLSEQATVTDLAQRMYLAQSSVTELVSRAEQAGLVVRRASQDDARVAYVRLTEEGERRLARSFRSLAAERSALRDAIAELEG
jgi:DNA-binding MarR family transcriptional regulator